MAKNAQFKEIIDDILLKFPEYHPSDYAKDSMNLAYVVVSDLYEYILNRIKANEKSEIILRFFNFINSYFNSPNQNNEVLNLLEIEILQQLPKSEEAYKLAKEYLSPKAKEWLPNKE